jgi:hypothetical protein
MRYPWDIRTSGDLFSNVNTSATVLHAMVLTAYGDELYGDEDTEAMDPVELWGRVREDFRVTVPEENENKLNALMLAISTDAFYDDPVAFTAICMSLSQGDLGDLVDGLMEDLTVPEMLWGIYEVELNRDDQPEFAKEILAVIDQTVAEQAEELNVEETSVVPAYEQYVAEARAEMFEDMRLLGIEEAIIRKLALVDLTPAHDESGMIEQENGQQQEAQSAPSYPSDGTLYSSVPTA